MALELRGREHSHVSHGGEALAKSKLRLYVKVNGVYFTKFIPPLFFLMFGAK